jgi:parallel beta-helix repeat protein
MVAGDTDGTAVGGTIRRDTIWTKEYSPYILDDDITVRTGATLRIQEGVIVDFKLWSMIITGELRATGNAEEHVEFQFTIMPLTNYDDARIVFTAESKPWKNNYQGSRFEYVDMYCSEDTVRYGLIQGGTLKLDHVTVHDSQPQSKYYTLNINGSITNSRFVGVARAITMGEGDIVDNTFIHDGLVRDNHIDGGRRGITVQNALVKNNTIINISYRGISLVNNPTSVLPPNATHMMRPIITNNLLMNSGEDAIYISGDIRPTISQNIFYENVNGIYFDENAFYNDEKPRIYSNVFYKNDNNVYFNREDPRIEIKLQNNWWGTDEPGLIEDKIYYETDDPRITAALYQPILSRMPSFLPKIPFRITLSQPTMDAEIDNGIPVSGRVYPPLDGYELKLTYSGPDEQTIDRALITDAYGLFVDELAPDQVGTWSITVESEENLLLESRTASAQVHVTEAENTIEIVTSPETIIEEDEAPVEATAPEGGTETDDDPATVSSDPSEGEVQDIQYETDTTPVPQTDEQASPSDPFIFGFIPSLVTIGIMMALYIGVNRFKLR